MAVDSTVAPTAASMEDSMVHHQHQFPALRYSVHQDSVHRLSVHRLSVHQLSVYRLSVHQLSVSHSVM